MLQRYYTDDSNIDQNIKGTTNHPITHIYTDTSWNASFATTTKYANGLKLLQCSTVFNWSNLFQQKTQDMCFKATLSITTNYKHTNGQSHQMAKLNDQ